MAAVLLGLVAPFISPVEAQVPAEPRLQGEVRVGDGSPASGATVVLHRVTAAAAGEIDSVTVASDGGFVLDLPTVPDGGERGAVYFASVRHQGVLYFGSPITTAIQLDSTYLIQVYDTVAAPLEGAPVSPTVRYMLAEELEDGWQITDLVQLDVPGERTWVAADSGTTWSYPLPEGIRDVQLGGGDLPPEEAEVRGGRLRLNAALPPGSRTVVTRYFVDSLFLDIPVPGGADEMDFLVRQPSPSVQVTGLIPAEVVEMDGVSYQRFAASDLAETTLQVRAVPESFSLSVEWVAVITALLLALVGVSFGRSRSGGHPGGAIAETRPAPGRGAVPTVPAAATDRQALVTEVARLDLAMEGLPDDEERRRLAARRAQLVERLRGLP